MVARTSLTRKASLRWTSVVAVTLASTGIAAPLSAASSLITIGEPAGFGDLARDQQLMVDIYFGGVRRGEALVRVTPETVSFVDPSAVLSILPLLSDAGEVLRIIGGGPLPANSDRACTPSSDPRVCGRLTTDNVGVILSRDRFRLDIFLNPQFIAIVDSIEERYLPTPSARLSLVNSVGGFVSGETRRGDPFVSVQNQLVLARGEQRLRADVSFDDDRELSANRLLVEWDRPERRYSAGLFWTPGNSLGGSAQIAGFGIESQIETRRDREELFGSPVTLYLDRRARVDALYDGRVVSSKIYEAGHQQVDTSGLPEGTYELTLRIEEMGGAAREERRVYSKSRRIPSLGRSDFYLFAGVEVPAPQDNAASKAVLLQGGYSRRMSPSLALDGQVSLGEEYQSAELGATVLSSIAQGRAALVASSDGRVGTLLRVTSTRSSPLNYSFDLRALSKAGSCSPEPLCAMGPSGPLTGGFTRQGYTQASGLVSYSQGGLRLLGTLYLRDEAGGDLRYAIGPSLEWDAARLGPAVFTLRGDVTATDSGAAGFAGLAVRLTGRRGTITALGGVRKSTLDDDPRGSGPSGAVAGAWSNEALGGRLATGAGYEFNPGEKSALASFEFAHPRASIAGEIATTDRNAGTTTQYTFGLQSTLIAAGDAALSLIGKGGTESVIVARITGARIDDRFEVLVDERVAGYIEGSRPSFLRMPAYNAYKVRIRPVGTDLVAYDSSPRDVGLFPGTVAQLEWQSAPVVIKLGQLVDARGNPIALATITGKGVWTQTDEAGYFQLEAPEDVTLEVTTKTGTRYALDLPRERNAGETTIRLGAVVCCLTDPAQQLSILTGPAERKVH